MKVQTFVALGGPLNGYEVTEQYAGSDYLRYNKAFSGARYKWMGRYYRADTCVLVYKFYVIKVKD
mgnify:CR=1 FL=1